MKRLPILFAFAALAPFTTAYAEPSRTYVASITGLDLGRHEYVERFTIDTWGIDVLAICNIPPGWRIRAGRSAAPDGVIEGESTHGVTFLDRDRVSHLQNLALIRVYGAGTIQREDIATEHGRVPATFDGRAEIGSYRQDGGRQVPLNADNIRLTPAARCPPR